MVVLRKCVRTLLIEDAMIISCSHLITTRNQYTNTKHRQTQHFRQPLRQLVTCRPVQQLNTCGLNTAGHGSQHLVCSTVERSSWNLSAQGYPQGQRRNRPFSCSDYAQHFGLFFLLLPSLPRKSAQQIRLLTNLFAAKCSLP